ncbi:MAG: gamma-glutamyl-gamma-aminobutyrate hydrolase family protein [Candidatus Bathyarchaeota archaeon]|nr:gamma-glutamyl-gamma-aminobutyrate hydrolase family protein [Candidatus Bathyarchaeota archaeon]
MILVVDMNWKKNSLGYSEFVLPIIEATQKSEKCVVKHYSEVADSDIQGCSRIILSGTTLKDNVTLEQTEKFAWLKTVDKPVLGVCAGMQTIGAVFGLLLTRSMEIGMTQVKTQNANPLCSGTFKAYSLHNYCVESSDEFEILAESTKCIQALKHKRKPLYGVLFHPEVRNLEIIKRFIQLKQ